MSTKVAGLAVKDGYKNVRVYLDGQPAWIKAHNMVYASKGTIEKGNIVLVDLRSVKKSEAGRIARSVTIPYDTFDDVIDDIPLKAPVVLYSDSDEDAAAAVADLRDEGYKKVALVAGGYAGWVKDGGATVKGPVVSEITWVRKPGKGEVSLDDFLKAVNGENDEVIILDVRTADEVAAGSYKRAISIPLDQIGARLADIPKDKKIYVHCTTGARAEMAAQELKKDGYKAFFLIADVECEGDTCEIDD
jgi:rhodanese-related sulfurtransferase